MSIVTPTTETPKTQEELLAPLTGLRETDVLYLGLDDKDPDWFRMILADSRGQSEFPSHAARHEFPLRLPEHRESKSGMGTVHGAPCTDVTATVIQALWPKNSSGESRLKFSGEDARTTYYYLLKTIAQQNQAMFRTAAYHEYVKYRDVVKALAIPVPQFVDDFRMGPDDGRGISAMRPMLQQRVGLANCLNTDGYLELMEQGTGKTGVVIGRVDWEATRPGRPTTPKGAPVLYKVLIVAPKNVRQNWHNEFEKFSAIPGRCQVLRGLAPIRRLELIQGLVPKHADEKYVAFVISYDALALDWESLLSKIPWDLAVLDESHFIKSKATKRWKYAQKLRDSSVARMCLTGTPVCNTPADLYTQLEFVRKGCSGFSKFEAFCDFYGVIKVADPRRTTKRFADVEHMPFMHERLARNSFVVKKKEALPDLPDKTYMIREVQMTPEQAEIYANVQDQLYHEIMDQESGKSRSMQPQNVLTKLLRLGQITSGFLTMDPIVDLDSGEMIAPKVIEAINPNPKLEALGKLMRGLEDEDAEDEERRDNPLEKTIVCCTWIWDITRVMERLEQLGFNPVSFYGATSDSQRIENERRFNEDPACRAMVMNPGCGGVGLNLVGYDWWNNGTPEGARLETNCTDVVYYSQDWSRSKRSQSEDRAHRRGTRAKVRYWDLVVPSTIDEEIRCRVLDKIQTADAIQDLRGILERVLGHK